MSSSGSAPRSVHQLVHTLSYGDAISTEVLAIQRALLESGIRSEIFALNEHHALRGRTRDLSVLQNEVDADIILHYSLGSPLNSAYRLWNRGRRILVYHNITPARWFRGVNERVALDIEQGILELPELCRLSDAIWADSPFNAAEIEGIGFSASVLDLPIDPARWDRPRNEGIFKAVSSTPGINVLHVGRLAPNKCLEDVIKSFYYLHRFLEPKSTLWLVGIDTDTELYSFGLRRLVAALGLEDSVRFMGCRADEEVRALYEACSVYLCMSEHEGFCLPIIESMHFGLPVIAYAAGAVPDTVGDGGVLVREKRHSQIGALIAEVANDQSLRTRLIKRGRERIALFSYARFSGELNRLVANSSVGREARAV